VPVGGRLLHSATFLPKHLASLDTSWEEKERPHNSSVMAATLRVETPWIYISMSARTRALSLLW